MYDDDADGDEYIAEEAGGDDCDDFDANINPGTAKDTYITYSGDFVFQADDYSVDPPTGDALLRAQVTDSDSEIEDTGSKISFTFGRFQFPNLLCN